MHGLDNQNIFYLHILLLSIQECDRKLLKQNSNLRKQFDFYKTSYYSNNECYKLQSNYDNSSESKKLKKLLKNV